MLPIRAGDVSVHFKPASNKTVNSQQLEGLHRTAESFTLDSLRVKPTLVLLYVAFAKQPIEKQDDPNDEPMTNKHFVKTSSSDT